jgi:hypothetical protein
MKKKDIGILVLVAVISAFVSYFLSGLLISSPKNRTMQVEVAAPISADFVRPNQTYFNGNSVNPTQNIVIQPVTNPNPFGN